MEEIETRRSDGGDKATNVVYAVRFNEKSNKQHENRSIYTKLTNTCTTSSPPDPQMCWNLSARSQGHRERYRCRRAKCKHRHVKRA